MKTVTTAKKPFSKGKYSPDETRALFDWEDAFDVEFDDCLSFLEPHRNIKKANKISAEAVQVRVSVRNEIPLTVSKSSTTRVRSPKCPGHSFANCLPSNNK